MNDSLFISNSSILLRHLSRISKFFQTEFLKSAYRVIEFSCLKKLLQLSEISAFKAGSGKVLGQ